MERLKGATSASTIAHHDMTTNIMIMVLVETVCLPSPGWFLLLGASDLSPSIFSPNIARVSSFVVACLHGLVTPPSMATDIAHPPSMQRKAPQFEHSPAHRGPACVPGAHGIRNTITIAREAQSRSAGAP